MIHLLSRSLSLDVPFLTLTLRQAQAALYKSNSGASGRTGNAGIDDAAEGDEDHSSAALALVRESLENRSLSRNPSFSRSNRHVDLANRLK